MSATLDVHLQLILLAGTVGFLALVLFDLLQLTERRPARLLLSIVGYGGVASSVLMQILFFDPPPAPVWLRTVLILLVHVAMLLLLYSLFFEIPLS